MNQFIEYIDRFYPKGVSVDDAQYFESRQFQSLLSARNKARSNTSQWTILKGLIEKKFPEYHLEDWSHLMHDAAFIGRLYFNGFESGGEHTKAIVFSVSIIAPFFMLYYSDQIKQGEVYLPPTIEFAPNSSNSDEWNSLVKCIKAAYPEFQEISTKVALQKVDDYCVGNYEMGEAMVAEYLFSDHIW